MKICEPAFRKRTLFVIFNRLAASLATCSYEAMKKVLDPDALIKKLNLSPLPGEGGYFRRTHEGAIGADGRAEFSVIYYLLTADNPRSALHFLPISETYHFYLGDPVDMLILEEDKPGRQIVLGPDILAGQMVQALVPAKSWHGSLLRQGGSFALLGTTMTPGFMNQDYGAADFAQLQKQYPKFTAEIEKLTGSLK